MDKICEKAISALMEKLGSLFRVTPTDSGCFIVTPFLRSDNEAIEIEIIQQPNNYLLTDGCETIDYLFVNGLSVWRSREIGRMLKHIGERWGINVSHDEISKTTDLENLGSAMYSILGAVQDASYLIYKKQHKTPVTFDDEVEKFLIGHEIRYDAHFRVTGKSRERNFRFHVNGNGHALIHPLTATSPHSAMVKAERLALWWVDIRDLKPRYHKIAVIDDVGSKKELWEADTIRELKEYSDDVVLWSNNESLSEAVSHRIY
jgi:hypothetical protein